LEGIYALTSINHRQIQSPKEYLLTDLGWLVTLLFRGSILTDSGRLVFFLGVR
jgi:hypothetical protein